MWSHTKLPLALAVAAWRWKDMPRAAPYCQLSAPAQCFLSSRTSVGGRGGVPIRLDPRPGTLLMPRDLLLSWRVLANQ